MRCSAEEYLELPADGFWYQLINGVVLMSPEPTPRHQRLLVQLVVQMEGAASRAGGTVLPEVDVRLGADLVYSPDIAYVGPGRPFSEDAALAIVPDLVVEILSPSSRGMDLRTKRSDYERFGVREYWVIDPEERRILLFRPRDGAFVESECSGATASSEVIPGLRFDLAAIRAVMVR